MKLLRAPSQSADEERKSQHEQQVADDAAGDRRLDQLDVPLFNATSAMINSAALPKVALRKPPHPGPERRASCSCAEADEGGERSARRRP
jgi:hypothetical protein